MTSVLPYGVQEPTIQSKQSDSAVANQRQCWAGRQALGSPPTYLSPWGKGKKIDTFGPLPAPGLGTRLRSAGHLACCISIQARPKSLGLRKAHGKSSPKQDLRSLWVGKSEAEGKMPAAALIKS